MKRFTSFGVLALILAGLFSCTSSPGAVQPGSSVWKISRNGDTLFLGGSIHILRDTDYPLPAEFDRAFSQSSVLVLEADIEQMADENIMMYLLSRTRLPDNKTLQSILERDAYEKLKAKCNEYGFSIDEVSKLKPSMVVTLLSSIQIQKFGFNRQGVDLYYLNRAKNENKPVDFLETVKTQIDALVSMGEGYESDYVRYSLYDMESTEDDISTLLTDWKEGDGKSTETMIRGMKEIWPEIYKTLLADRNAAWMPQIEDFLDSGQVHFVIVGLAHLHGPDGLLRQLKDSGCTVERLNLTHNIPKKSGKERATSSR